MTTLTIESGVTASSPGPARVAIFVADFSATGVVVNALAIAGELVSRGAEVQFVATRAEGTLRSSVPAGIPVMQLLPDGAPASRRKRLQQSMVAYRRFVKNLAPGVIFSAGNHGHLTTAAAAVGRRDVRVIVRISNDLERGAPKSRQGFLARRIRRFKFRRITEKADRIIFVSHQLRLSWAGIGAADAAKSVVIPNGVDATAVRQKAGEPCEHPWLASMEVPLVLGVGRLAEQKNFEALIRAVGLAARTSPLRLLLIGEGPLDERLRSEAASAGLGDNFQIIPPVANPMPYLAGAAVVALPSWREGASNVLLEAMACGTAVVASRTAGNAEEVLDGGEFGILVDPRNLEEIAAALLQQSGVAAVRPGDRALQFSRQAALDAYADLLIEEARAAASRP